MFIEGSSMTPSPSQIAAKRAATRFVMLFVLSLSLGQFNPARDQSVQAASQQRAASHRLQLMRYQGQQQSDMAPHRGSGRYTAERV